MKTQNIIATTFGAIVGSIVASIIPSIIGGWFLMVAWNAIAWEFNLPQFGYWVCFCAYYVIRTIFSAKISLEKKD
jgi:large-conductance mechanosensitive channel